MMPKAMVKGICIALAVLMVLSVGAIVLQVIAAEPFAIQNYEAPVTGDNDADYIIPVGIGLLAVLAVVVCIALPKLRKKEDDTE